MRYRGQYRNSRERIVTAEVMKLEMRTARQQGSPHHNVLQGARRRPSTRIG